MTQLFVSVGTFPACEMQILVTSLGIHYFNSSSQIKKITWSISCSKKALTTFRNDTPNSHVPGINFLDFFVHAL